MMTKLSIVIPTYMQGKYIKDCLSSISTQEFQNFEVIIQDSCSTDETQDICEQFVKVDARFQYFREKDNGQSDAINRGLARSSGLYWTWICSDDLYANPNSLGALVEKLQNEVEQDPNTVGVFGRAESVSNDGSYLEEYSTDEREISNLDFKTNWPFSQPASILVRNDVVAAGGVNPQLHLGMDLDLFIRITKPGKVFKFCSEKIAKIRIQPDSKSVKYRQRTAECALGIIKFYYGDVGTHSHSAYSRELAYSRLEKIKSLAKYFSRGFVDKKGQKSIREETRLEKKINWIMYRLKSKFKPMMSLFLVKYVLSFNLGNFYSKKIVSEWSRKNNV